MDGHTYILRAFLQKTYLQRLNSTNDLNDIRPNHSKELIRPNLTKFKITFFKIRIYVGLGLFFHLGLFAISLLQIVRSFGHRGT